MPSKVSFLFGHHFSSIAGAGPIVGPILAFALFGWLPAILWILVGSVFIGAVHDYTILMLSVRHDGKSIVEISKSVISKRSKAIFAVFVWITLLLIQAVFADLVAKTLVSKPEIAVPTFSLVIIAILFGLGVIRFKMNEIIGTVLALILLGMSMYLGELFPIYASEDVWTVITILYCFFASVLPVQVLLQPRDYISMYILVIGLLLGFLGIIVLQPEINAPAFVSFNSKSGPLFPILFITIACAQLAVSMLWFQAVQQLNSSTTNETVKR